MNLTRKKKIIEAIEAIDSEPLLVKCITNEIFFIRNYCKNRDFKVTLLDGVCTVIRAKKSVAMKSLWEKFIQEIAKKSPEPIKICDEINIKTLQSKAYRYARIKGVKISIIDGEIFKKK
jgi:hypothetical protein